MVSVSIYARSLSFGLNVYYQLQHIPIFNISNFAVVGVDFVGANTRKRHREDKGGECSR